VQLPAAAHPLSAPPCSSSNTPASLPTPDLLYNIIKARRSIYPKHMTGGTVSKHDITALLEAANWAPTHGKTEPWRFVVLGQQGMQAMQDVTEEVYKLKLAAQPDRLQVRPTTIEQPQRHCLRWPRGPKLHLLCLS
jgi:nitroreductase